MKIELRVKEVSTDTLKLIDDQGEIVSLPSRYYDRELQVGEVVFLNPDDDNNQAKQILAEVFKQD